MRTEKLKPSSIAGGNVKWQSCWETVWHFLKTQNGITLDPVIPLSGTVNTQENRNHTSKQKPVQEY